MKKKAESGGFLLGILVIFLGIFAVLGPETCNDSDQYIKMHIHREPLYPLFLAGLRHLFGEGWMTAMGIVQNVFVAFSIWRFAEYIGTRFSLRLWEKVVVIVVEIVPYIFTMWFSAMHIFMTNTVMSEAICLPLFTLFMMEAFKIIIEKDMKTVHRAMAGALVLALLLSLTRSQMMLTILMWMIVVGVRILLHPGKKKAGSENVGDATNGVADENSWSIRKKLLHLVAVIAVVVLVFVVRILAVKTYNLVYNEHFINNTYGTVNILTHVLYAADREDGEHIEDEIARGFFYLMYDLAEDQKANYKYAGDTMSQRADYIEVWHDKVKFDMIEDVFYQVFDDYVTTDYVKQNLLADKAAGEIIRGLLPQCIGQWLGNYFAIARYGMIRSVAVVHPVLNWVALFVYLSAAVLVWLVYRLDKKNPAVAVMLIAVLGVVANVAAVSITIMCLERYMIYGFVPFYVGYFLLLITLGRRYYDRSGKQQRLLRI